MEQYDPEVASFIARHHNLLLFPGLYPGYVTADARRTGLQVEFFMYEDEGGAYFHPFHLCPVLKTPYYEILSAYGYGGPVASTDEAAFLARVFDYYKYWCKERNVVVETILFHPVCKNWRYYKGEILTKKNTIYIDLTLPDLLALYSARARTAIRKAVKSNIMVQTVRTEEFLEVFPPLYYELMKKINAHSKYYFSMEYFSAICRLENAYPLIAVREGEVVGGAIFLLTDHIMEYHLSASNELGKQLCVTNLLLHEAFLYARERGCSYAHLGGGVTNDPKDPLLFFKSGFAGQLAEFKIGKYIHAPALYSHLLNIGALKER